MKLGLGPGTWASDDPLYTPDSLWWRWLEAQGVTVRLLDWPAALGGFGPSRHVPWQRAADSWAEEQARDPVDVWLLHSHAGQAGAMAIAAGAVVHLLVTVCTPVRQDLQPTYHAAAARLDAQGGFWRHLYGGERDVVGQFGGFGDGALSFQRAMAASHCNVYRPDRGHGSGEWFSPNAFDLRWLS